MTQINPIQKKIPDTSRLVKKQTILLKLLKEIESEIPSDRGLAKTSALTVVVNKIPNISNLVKKKDHDSKISDIESKYITATDYNKFTKDVVHNSIKNKN